MISIISPFYNEGGKNAAGITQYFGVKLFFGYNPESGIGSSACFYDKYLFPISRLLYRLGCKYLFGKNIVVVPQKT